MSTCCLACVFFALLQLRACALCGHRLCRDAFHNAFLRIRNSVRAFVSACLRICKCVCAPSAGIVGVEMHFTMHFCAFATSSVLFTVRFCASANAFVQPLRGSRVSRCCLQCVFARLQMRSCTLCGDRGSRDAFYSVFFCALTNAFVHPLRGSWVSRCFLQCVCTHLQMRSCTLCGDRGCRHAFYSVFLRICKCVRAPSAGIVGVDMRFTVCFCAFANAFVHPLRGSWVSRCVLQCVFAHLQMRSCTLCGDRGCRDAFYSVFLLICKCVRAPFAGIVGVDMRFTVCFCAFANAFVHPLQGSWVSTCVLQCVFAHLQMRSCTLCGDRGCRHAFYSVLCAFVTSFAEPSAVIARVHFLLGADLFSALCVPK